MADARRKATYSEAYPSSSFSDFIAFSILPSVSDFLSPFATIPSAGMESSFLLYAPPRPREGFASPATCGGGALSPTFHVRP